MIETSVDSRDRLAALEALLPEMPAARERVTLGDELRNVGEWLQQHASTLEGFSRACIDSASLACEQVPERGTAIEALATVKDFGSTLAEADNTNDLKAIREEAKDALKAIRDFHNFLRHAYNSILTTKLQPLGATGELIADIDPSSTLGRRLTDFGARANNVLSRQGHLLAAGAREALGEASALRAEVAVLATEPEQMAFLDALVAGNAPLSLLTPGVFAWLDRLGGLDRFVVRPQAHR